jgi:prolyl-tRNA synthetase
MAPFQVVIVPIWRKDEEKDQVLAATDRISGMLKQAGVRVKVDDSDAKSPGWKFNEWEMKGVPLRIEIGPRDLENNSVTLARRDRPGKEGKTCAGIDSLAQVVPQLLEEIQQALYQRALDFRKANTRHVSTFRELARAIEDRQFADAFWCGDPACEEKIKDETKASNRCMPIDQPGDSGQCVVCGKPSSTHAIFARAY